MRSLSASLSLAVALAPFLPAHANGPLPDKPHIYVAGASGRKLGPVYSISEFRLRTDAWQLQSSRFMTSGSGVPPELALEGLVIASGAPLPEPFTPGLIRSQARAFVAFEVEKQ